MNPGAELPRILSVSVTARGRQLAKRLPFEHAHGSAAATVRSRWGDFDGFVIFLALGAVVRMIGPLLADKRTDPSVVCVDESGRYAISLSGGHARPPRPGANTLAREVAALLGAEPVVTTATDVTGTVAPDAIEGFAASGDVAGVTAAMLDNRCPAVENPMGWAIPEALVSGPGPERIVVTDHASRYQEGVVVLHPPSLVAGIGAASDATADEIRHLLALVLHESSLSSDSLCMLATIDRRRERVSLAWPGYPVAGFSPESLAAVRVPFPSPAVESAVGTPSVAEAAALLAAGPGAELVVAKHKSSVATVALARRKQPAGKLLIVGLGPGNAAHRTPAAAAAIRQADTVIGYGPYIDQCSDLLSPSQDMVSFDIGSETQRARRALDLAWGGRRVALVCSGDPGIYAMASPALEIAYNEYPSVEVEMVPGVTAATAVAGLLGAPLAHDHASISLSDLLTPWDVIERRLRSAAESDLVVALYNPRSTKRTWQLEAACRILLAMRCPATPVGIVHDAARANQKIEVTTLGELDTNSVDMTSCLIVGSSSTRMAGGWMLTPRGYKS